MTDSVSFYSDVRSLQRDLLILCGELNVVIDNLKNVPLDYKNECPIYSFKVLGFGALLFIIFIFIYQHKSNQIMSENFAEEAPGFFNVESLGASCEDSFILDLVDISKEGGRGFFDLLVSPFNYLNVSLVSLGFLSPFFHFLDRGISFFGLLSPFSAAEHTLLINKINAIQQNLLSINRDLYLSVYTNEQLALEISSQKVLIHSYLKTLEVLVHDSEKSLDCSDLDHLLNMLEANTRFLSGLIQDVPSYKGLKDILRESLCLGPRGVDLYFDSPSFNFASGINNLDIELGGEESLYSLDALYEGLILNYNNDLIALFQGSYDWTNIVYPSTFIFIGGTLIGRRIIKKNSSLEDFKNYDVVESIHSTFYTLRDAF